jgi:hypothetical protein
MCITRISLRRREKYHKLEYTWQRLLPTTRTKTKKRKENTVIHPNCYRREEKTQRSFGLNMLLIPKKPTLAHNLASSKIACAKATSINAVCSCTLRFLSFQIDQATNQAMVSKPFCQNLGTKFHACNHQYAIDNSAWASKPQDVYDREHKTKSPNSECTLSTGRIWFQPPRHKGHKHVYLVDYDDEVGSRIIVYGDVVYDTHWVSI